MPKLHEVLEAIGETNLRYQYLHQCATKARVAGRGKDQHTSITFGTKGISVADAMGIPTSGNDRKIGIMVFVDLERFNNAIASIQADEADQKAKV